MASVIIWLVISLIQVTDLTLGEKNLYTFFCSTLLFPLSVLFAGMIHADSFKKSKNPFDKLGLICTMNQMLYLLIVMWAFNEKPEAMMMLYAMVFSAHLLPYGWVYDSPSYKLASVLGTIGALLTALVFGNFVTGLFMVVLELLLTVLLFMEVKKLG